jgi:hypothetical protein
MGTFSPVADVVGARARSIAGLAAHRRANGGPFYFNFSRGTFVALLGASMLLAFAQAWAAWLLWAGKRSGALLEFGLLPVEAAFWYGFALPIPPLLAIARLVLTALAWRGLE